MQKPATKRLLKATTALLPNTMQRQELYAISEMLLAGILQI